MEMKIGIVGCGGISYSHGNAVRQSDCARIVACADILMNRAKEYALQYGIENAYNSLEAMMESKELDLIILATWPALHLQQIRKACELGTKAILCEKSLALNGKEADEIAHIVEDSGIFLMEAFMYRHHPQVHKVKELIDDGVIGQVSHIYGQFTFPVDSESENWRAKKELGGGSMMDQGCYMVNALNYFAGVPAKEVFCKTTLYEKNGLDIGHAGTIIYSNGVVGQFNSNQRAMWSEILQVCGSTGIIVIPKLILTVKQPRYILLQRQDKEERYEFEALDSYLLQIENIYECLFEDASPNMPLQDTIKNMCVISALLKSGETGRMASVLN